MLKLREFTARILFLFWIYNMYNIINSTSLQCIKNLDKNKKNHEFKKEDF
jgi:hypothetical protein